MGFQPPTSHGRGTKQAHSLPRDPSKILKPVRGTRKRRLKLRFMLSLLSFIKFLKWHTKPSAVLVSLNPGVLSTAWFWQILLILLRCKRSFQEHQLPLNKLRMGVAGRFQQDLSRLWNVMRLEIQFDVRTLPVFEPIPQLSREGTGNNCTPLHGRSHGNMADTPSLNNHLLYCDQKGLS